MVVERFIEAEKNTSSIISLRFENNSDIERILEQYPAKKYFVEVIIPRNIFSIELLEKVSNVGRVIVEFEDKAQIKDLDIVFSELIARKFYPFTKGIPPCNTDIKHCIERFQEPLSLEKPSQCNGCILQNFCSFGGQGFARRQCYPSG